MLKCDFAKIKPITLFSYVQSQESEENQSFHFHISSPSSTTDFAHPLWLSYALSCSQRLQMPSRPLQLAGLSHEPVYQQGYLTASAAPGASDSLSGWEGCQQSPWKDEQKKKKRKSEGITVEGQEWQRCFIATTLVAKNKPNYPLKKGQWMASLIFTVGLVTALWLAPLRRSPWVWGGVCCYFLIKILFKMYTALKFFN